MEKEENEARAIADFTAFMYQKGYRQRFTIEQENNRWVFGPCNLSDCLKTAFHLERKISNLEFKTHAPYNDKIECRFKIAYDEVKGFLIREMKISDAVSQQSHFYSIRSNRQLPGANSLEGLFPKPKPWDHIIKGRRFRP